MTYTPDPELIEFYEDEPWDPSCTICGSSLDYQVCDACDGGYVGHDCGEDCCACLHPEDNIVCDICEGKGGWWQCLNAKNHPKEES